jgi:hypothetical protein
MTATFLFIVGATMFIGAAAFLGAYTAVAYAIESRRIVVTFTNEKSDDHL